MGFEYIAKLSVVKTQAKRILALGFAMLHTSLSREENLRG